jgi:hypothetical protein
MNCRKVRRYLFGYFKQELSSDLMKGIKAHLENCPKCAREAEDVQCITFMVRDDMETLLPSDDFNQKLLAKIQALSPQMEPNRERSWWQKLIHEIFPSIRLRWALAGAAATVILAWAVVLIQRPAQIEPELYSEGTSEIGVPINFDELSDSSYQNQFGRLVRTSAPTDGKTFVIDNFNYSIRGMEDGRVRPEDLYKRFLIEKRPYTTTTGGTQNRYVLPVVSTRPVSQKVDY